MGLIASCPTADLVREMAAVSKASSKRSTLPILNNVLIEAETEGLILSATDLTSRLRVFVPGKVTEPGSTTVSITDLLHLLGQFEKDGKTSFVLDGNRLLVADGAGASGSLQIIAADEMPVRLPTEKWDVVARIDATVLSDLIARAVPFCARDQARPILTGVNVSITADKITFGAADNYVVTGLDGPITNGVETTVVIPSTALKLLLGTLDKTEASVTLRVKDSFVSFSFNQYETTIAGIDGQYPKYEQVFPRYTPWDGEIGSYGITVDRKALLKALKLARRGDSIIHLVTALDSITVTIPDPNESGKIIFAKSITAIVIPDREDRIGFNPELLVRVLNIITAPTVTLFRNDPSVNVAFGIETGDPTSRYAIMPVKLAS